MWSFLLLRQLFSYSRSNHFAYTRSHVSSMIYKSVPPLSQCLNDNEDHIIETNVPDKNGDDSLHKDESVNDEDDFPSASPKSTSNVLDNDEITENDDKFSKSDCDFLNEEKIAKFKEKIQMHRSALYGNIEN